MDNNDLKTLLKAQQGELDAVLMYKALADVVKDKNDAETSSLQADRKKKALPHHCQRRIRRGENL